MTARPANLDDPLPLARALRALDRRLAAAVDVQAQALGVQSLADPWRGLRIERADVERLLAGERPAPRAHDAALVAPLGRAARAVPRLARVGRWLGLGAIDLAAVLIALAPELELRYERVYAYLQDDVARKRPSLDLVAQLLAPTPEMRLALFARFAADAPMAASGLLELHGTDDAPQPARAVVVGELWRHWLGGRVELDAALADSARLLPPGADGLAELPLEPPLRAQLQTLCAQAHERGALRLLLHGPHGAGKQALVHALAQELGLRLLDVDVRGWTTPHALRGQLRHALRAAVLFAALPLLRGVDALSASAPAALRALVDLLAATPASFVVIGTVPWSGLHASPLAAARITLGYPCAAQRRQLWARALQAAPEFAADDDALDRVAACFSLSRAQIGQAACDALTAATLDGHQRLGYAQLAAAARAQSGAELARLAQRVTPQANFDSLVTVPEVSAQLREICTRVATRELVRSDWGGGGVHTRGVGITALFAGPSGTGKTLAAEAVARELGLDLYRIDLAAVVSKYIGETEKNLDRVFSAAEHANAVLFFDEADSLFGKRSEVKDAHDRYANIEIAYLLQKMEQFDGLAILATNLKQNLDDAFARRLSFTLNFPFPETPERERLWRQLWPPLAPRADDVDLAWFAREFRLSGGNIRNALLAAAHLAAADGRVVTRAHLLHATRREFQKLGKTLGPMVREVPA